jgi:hypothetical protein
MGHCEKAKAPLAIVQPLSRKSQRDARTPPQKKAPLTTREPFFPYLVTTVVTVFDVVFPSGPSGFALLTFAWLLIFVPTPAVAFTLITTSTGLIKDSEGVVQVTVLPATLQLAGLEQPELLQTR